MEWMAPLQIHRLIQKGNDENMNRYYIVVSMEMLEANTLDLTF